MIRNLVMYFVFLCFANKSNVIASLEKEIEELVKGNENPKDGLEALAKLKEQIEKYENHLKDIGDKND